jgi:hypothetical protein
MNLKRVLVLGNLSLLLTATYCYSDDSDLPIFSDNATLIGRAILPAATFAEGPTSGTLLGTSPINGVNVPFVDKQPVQGFSAVLANGDGTFLAMSDNGFGSQQNSADYNLRVYTIRPDFKTKDGGSGTITVAEPFIELSDPNNLIPFAITNEFTKERVLTGADFDIESFQKAPDGTFWFGDEFGPFLLHTDAKGVLLDAPIPLPDFDNPGKEIRSPQNPFNNSTQAPFVRAKPSGGFEGMAITPDGSKLVPLLEKPLAEISPTEAAKLSANLPLPKRLKHNRKILLMHEFDIASKTYTGVRYKYPLDARAKAIGDFILFAPNKGLVIERDSAQGNMNAFKMIYKITLNSDGEQVDKTPVANLLNIADPNGISEGEVGDVGIGKTFGFPFVTIEDIVVLGDNQIGVLNDNNYPFSVGRHVGSRQPDDNEFIIIELDSDVLQ